LDGALKIAAPVALASVDAGAAYGLLVDAGGPPAPAGVWHSRRVLDIQHLSILGGRPMAVTRPDLSLLEGTVAPKVLHAMRVSSSALTRLGVRHTLVGGLAVGAYGYPRATKDVDFLVGEEAFEHHEGGLVTMKPGVPIQVSGVAIDFLSIGRNEAHLAAALSEEVAPAPVLVFLKLKSPRSKDRTDIVELIKAGMDVERVRAYVDCHEPSFTPKLDEIVRVARAEEE